MNFYFEVIVTDAAAINTLKDGQLSLVKMKRCELAASIKSVQDQAGDHTYIGDSESPGGIKAIPKTDWLATNEPALVAMDAHIAELEA